jgi:integrase
LKYQKARLAPKSYEREEGIIKNHLAPFSNLQIAAIRKVDVQRYVTEASTERAPGCVRQELVTLKHLFNLAVEWEIIPTNPAQGVKSPKMPAGRLRYLQPTELRALLEACPDVLRQIVALAVSTGMRRGEIMGLRYLDVDLSNRRIMLPQTKNGDARIVSVVPKLAEVAHKV